MLHRPLREFRATVQTLSIGKNISHLHRFSQPFGANSHNFSWKARPRSPWRCPRECAKAYPIPVIEVNGFCDIEIQPRQVSVSTKLSRSTALSYSFEKFTEYNFEAYGVEDYLADFYHPGQTIEQLKEKIRGCHEEEIGFSFVFPFQVEGQQMFEFVKLLGQEGFYY